MATPHAGESGEPDDRAHDPRRQQLLDAATRVFIRFGFRKASMDEVARAAGISRQGLYLHFATKEDLFRAAMQNLVETAMDGVTSALDDASVPLETRLVRAFDEWVGKYVGVIGADAADLIEASRALVGSLVTDHEMAFIAIVTKAVRSSGLVAAYKPVGLTARQLADTLYATARGLKYSSGSRESFVQNFTVAVRALCFPLRGAV